MGQIHTDVDDVPDEEEMVMSPFMDMTEEEFAAKHLTPFDESQIKQFKGRETPLKFKYNLDKEVPESFDWRDYDAVTPVKSQGECGSCYTFATTGVLEGQLKLKHGELTPLSKQQIIDCDENNRGCHGGAIELAVWKMLRMGGIQSEEDYPYTGEEGTCRFDRNRVVVQARSYSYVSQDEEETNTGEEGTCRFDRNRVVVQARSYSYVSQDEEEIKEALFRTGPLYANVNSSTLQFYWWGTHHPWSMFCDPADLNHAVLIVGYGRRRGMDFWMIKNSWGDSWGKSGYFRLYRGDGTCGINRGVLTAE
eukprot:CAMPEP_0170536556 /NCGR_PEP_ID=MMETSP0209-20121228/102213_1 /TAXON_ID=665100 ORGANISM="Litonotus pictus, Strain P1" /NCGR_SAMPLE_ID=MMETSP0209 /ASSEMBLY_ACC=CAM_ASM_000301 /LENGTH=306 /DNA_ID=CAMNT_0010837929 /DNA_START=176 /DNA_END=1094 /DNA_ORIENTATION=-